MNSVVVSDTTSLIVLEKLQRLELLCQLFDQVLVPEVVLRELEAGSPAAELMLQNHKCFEVVTMNPKGFKRLNSLLFLLDAGEAHAIALAADRSLPLIIDERKGRGVAQQLNIAVTGFAGLIILAKRKNILDEQTALDLLDQSVSNGLRLSDRLLAQVKAVLMKL